MSSEMVGALIAVALGIWAYTDATALAHRGIRVGRFSPLAWGFGVALVAIFFGILYLRQRSRAVAAPYPSAPPMVAPEQPMDRPPMPPLPGAPEPASTERDRFCRSCGHELPTYVASFCPKCGRQL